MREFLYISDRKLDSYEAQVPPGLAKELSAEVSASIGVLSAKLKSKDPATDRVSRVELVSEFIARNCPVGTLIAHEPDRSWVCDTLSVRQVRIPAVPSVFLLVGTSDSEEVCALIGSTGHVLGTASGEPTRFSASYFHAFVDAIAEAQVDASSDLAHSDLMREPRRLITGNSDQEVAAILNRFQWDASGREFAVKFLARSVFRGQATGHPPTNAFSPLWVEIL